jgi:hypothetical protein
MNDEREGGAEETVLNLGTTTKRKYIETSGVQCNFNSKRVEVCWNVRLFIFKNERATVVPVHDVTFASETFVGFLRDFFIVAERC